MGIAQVQELRDAVLAFRAAGKSAVAFAETFGEFGPGNGAYYLATAFDEIYLQPSGDVGLTGDHVRDAVPARDARQARRRAADGPPLRVQERDEHASPRRAYTEAHREAMQKVMRLAVRADGRAAIADGAQAHRGGGARR